MRKASFHRQKFHTNALNSSKRCLSLMLTLVLISALVILFEATRRFTPASTATMQSIEIHANSSTLAVTWIQRAVPPSDQAT
ncbi:hypothetical protein BC830DRAFT_904327 [Chytriomyces sp. MP71]|nr:hypothetical protein BC830DRAFT_904327 [Chytriomyces sp. MP71]